MRGFAQLQGTPYEVKPHSFRDLTLYKNMWPDQHALREFSIWRICLFRFLGHGCSR